MLVMHIFHLFCILDDFQKHSIDHARTTPYLNDHILTVWQIAWRTPRGNGEQLTTREKQNVDSSSARDLAM